MGRPRGSKNKPKELGNAIEEVTKATGIKTVVDAVAKVTGKDCGCNERKQLANAYEITNKFPYINLKAGCMNEEQVEFYEGFKEKFLNKKATQVTIKGDDFNDIINLYNSVFQTNVKGCKSCTINVYIDKIEKVYQRVKKEAEAA